MWTQINVDPKGGAHVPRGSWDSEEHISQGIDILIHFIGRIRIKFPKWNNEEWLKGLFPWSDMNTNCHYTEFHSVSYLCLQEGSRPTAQGTAISTPWLKWTNTQPAKTTPTTLWPELSGSNAMEAFSPCTSQRKHSQCYWKWIQNKEHFLVY